jgi:hypothetical protein
LTIVIALGAYFFVYNYPATAEFLTEDERKFIQFRLKNDSDATRDEKFNWEGVRKAFKDPKVWLYGMGFHTLSLPLYTLSLFLVSPVSIEVPSIRFNNLDSHRSSRTWATLPLRHSSSPCHRTPSPVAS